MHARVRRPLLRRTLPAVLLPLSLLGLAPATQAAPAAPAVARGGDAPTAEEVTGALDRLPDALVPDTAPVVRAGAAAVLSGTGGDLVSVPRDAEDRVHLGPADAGLAIGLPVTDAGRSVLRDGVSIFTDAAAATSVAVNPLEGGGTQFLVAIGTAGSPETYAFPVDVPDGARLELTEVGGARVTDGGGTLATIPAPWAKDARGADDATHYEIDGGALVQVVDHVGSGAAYPVLADPSVKPCSFYTAACVTLSRAEVRHISASWAGGAFAGIATTCSVIPSSPWYMAAIKLTCAVTIGAKGSEFVAAIRTAQATLKCVEVKWSIIATPFLSGTKVVSC